MVHSLLPAGGRQRPGDLRRRRRQGRGGSSSRQDARLLRRPGTFRLLEAFFGPTQGSFLFILEQVHLSRIQLVNEQILFTAQL